MKLTRVAQIPGILMFLLCWSMGCKTAQSGQPDQQPMMLQTAQFQYVVSDADSHELIHGTMTMPWPIEEGQVVHGSWESRYSGKLDDRGGIPTGKVGPQIGRGTLAANREGGQVRISLNPNMNDNNVTFTATIDGQSLRGQWEYATFVGVTGSGIVEAEMAK